jgi:hypothetical protein
LGVLVFFEVAVVEAWVGCVEGWLCCIDDCVFVELVIDVGFLVQEAEERDLLAWSMSSPGCTIFFSNARPRVLGTWGSEPGGVAAAANCTPAATTLKKSWDGFIMVSWYLKSRDVMRGNRDGFKTDRTLYIS